METEAARKARENDTILLTNKPGARKVLNDLYNPCTKEQMQANKCMQDTNYDNSQCSIYFKNVMYCKMFWQKVKKDRARAHIKPNLPPPEERDSIRKEYMEREVHAQDDHV